MSHQPRFLHSSRCAKSPFLFHAFFFLFWSRACPVPRRTISHLACNFCFTDCPRHISMYVIVLTPFLVGESRGRRSPDDRRRYQEKKVKPLAHGIDRTSKRIHKRQTLACMYRYIHKTSKTELCHRPASKQPCKFYEPMTDPIRLCPIALPCLPGAPQSAWMPGNLLLISVGYSGSAYSMTPGPCSELHRGEKKNLDIFYLDSVTLLVSCYISTSHDFIAYHC